MLDVAFYLLLVLHFGTVAGMVVAVALQLRLAPSGPLKRLKWVWLPTVGGAAVTGLLVWLAAALVARDGDPVKMIVKIGVLALGCTIAARYHAVERSATPRWAIPALTTVVVGEVLMSLAWR